MHLYFRARDGSSKIPSQLHLWLTAASFLLLWPVCRATRVLPDLSGSVASLFFSWVVQSVVVAGLLYQFAVPGAWQPVWEHRWRFLPAAAILLSLFFYMGSGFTAALFCLFVLVGLEFHFRSGDWLRALWSLLPWVYLAAGIQIAFTFNTAIVTVRPYDLYDLFFRTLDARLFHLSVAAINHAATGLYPVAEAIYYSIGGFMGAGLLFLCLAGDRSSAFRLAGAIVCCYFLSLLVFFAFPSNGPYILDPPGFPPGLATDAIQRASQANAAALYHHRQWLSGMFGYFVAFPSMHVAQPLIAAWFLRRWKWVSAFIFFYCALLVPAILILEWHYAVDIVGGILIAMLAMKISSLDLPWTRLRRKPQI